MIISAINSGADPVINPAFAGKMIINPKSKYAHNNAIKEFKEYIETKTDDNLYVYLAQMPEKEGKQVNVYDWWDHFDKQAYDNMYATRNDKPPRTYWGAERYGGMQKENLKIIYDSPRTHAQSGFYLDSRQEYGVPGVYAKYLKENLKTNAALDVLG